MDRVRAGALNLDILPRYKTGVGGQDGYPGIDKVRPGTLNMDILSMYETYPVD